MNYFAKLARMGGDWVHNVRFKVSTAGEFDTITGNSHPEGADIIQGVVVPGMPNLHSHAFQRAMAGMAETRFANDDDFWRWRRLMYHCANSMTPERLSAIASLLYMEMLKAGYTSVAEFHYLYHGPDGKPYAEKTAMAGSIIEAAENTGIGLTLLPTLYQLSNFNSPALDEQRRFINSVDEFTDHVQHLFPYKTGQVEVGVAIHSLRAVPQESIAEIISLKERLKIAVPLHIHVAEQEKEVSDCVQHTGFRSVAWLIKHFTIDDSWCLIHTTHVNQEELVALADSGCVVGLCPTTEANLGDGIFPATYFLDAGGMMGIGSDSHISINPLEELRWLEYGQRLQHKKRNRLVGKDHPHNGSYLWDTALAGGARACGRPVDGIKIHNRADFVVLDDQHPVFTGKGPEQYLDALVFAGNTNAVKDVMVGGEWVVRDGSHVHEQTIRQGFADAMHSLFTLN